MEDSGSPPLGLGNAKEKKSLHKYASPNRIRKRSASRGFQSTAHEHLLVYWTEDADPRRRRQMIAKANSFAPF